MKKLFILGCCMALISCAGNNRNPENPADTVSGANETAKTQESSVDTNDNKIGNDRKPEPEQKGEILMAASDCGTCHKMDQKLVGPSLTDIAKKYDATSERIDSLAGKIIKGGVGVWGEVPMTAHPQISLADAKEMVNYILSLKKSN